MDLTDLLSFVFAAGFGRETNDREDMKNSRSQGVKESRSQGVKESGGCGCKTKNAWHRWARKDAEFLAPIAC